MTVCYHHAEGPKRSAVTWRGSMEICKSEFHSYLFGDLPVGNERAMCKAINTILPGPTWVGIATQLYISLDQGNILYILLSLIRSI